MSYSQFGYTYPSSSQILVSGQHPMSVSPCCPASGPPGSAADGSGGGGGGESRLLSPFPRLAPAGAFSLYGYAEHPLSTLAGTATSAFYPSLPSPYDLKESRTSWSALQPSSAPACYPYDPSGLTSCGPYGDRYGTIDSVARRKNATRETTNTLKAWLYEHRKNPYPTKGEKIMLAIITKMTLTQVSTWFANARRRLKKENKMTWEPRNKTSEGDDRDSSSPRDKSDDNTEEDSNMAPSSGVNNIDFLKQESDGYISKHTFSEFDESKSLPPGKNCYGLNCSYRQQQPQSSEDSGASGSPSPGRPLHQVVPCYGDRFDPAHPDGSNGNKPEGGKDVFCDQTFGSGGPRPKIWSLARTATSNSPPPLVRRYPTDYCLEKEDCGGGDKIKTGYSSCSVQQQQPYPDYPEPAGKSHHPADELCCDSSRPPPPVYLPTTKRESADCLVNSGQCMVGSGQCSYEYEQQHYTFKPADKDLCAIEYPTSKCQPLDGGGPMDAPSCQAGKKLMPPYAGTDPGAGARTDFYGAGFEQQQGLGAALHKGAAPSGMEIPDSGAMLRRSDH